MNCGNDLFSLVLCALISPFFAASYLHKEIKPTYPIGAWFVSVFTILILYGIIILIIYGIVKLFPDNKEEREYFKSLPTKDVLDDDFARLYDSPTSIVIPSDPPRMFLPDSPSLEEVQENARVAALKNYR